MVPIDDTALAVTDTGGPGTPVVYLNGSYASKRHWRRVIAELGPGYRHITFDERARGKSKLATDYSFEACMRDIDAVLDARGVDRPLLVGWSYGALLGVHWASRNPARALGVVGVDGPYPVGWTDEAGHDEIRKVFKRMRPLMPLVRPLGLAARFSAETHADLAIESHLLHAALEPVVVGMAVPVRYVVASGEAVGSRDDLQEQMRKSIDPLLVRNPNLKVSAKVGSNHGSVLRKDSRAVAVAVREVAALGRPGR
ncbi:alpha/beta fold hydrolase [Promicromonospora iranensis]|uniref:Pimeloyl-ACP methyl ester carboxylesterase n=1 Tax=Promicromonospora iranensis TaxID=1105144 RepID=A0ABU2CVI0_9MICO|nr:alpha/beta fold hydrolase [Promicromonospora iranensis]MDR7385347.1 pimeloyl-ACP methyl ester carboxylesterase [Promicromonospora iranensis]